MSEKTAWIRQALDDLQQAGLYNRIRTLGSPQGAWLVVDGRKVLNFCSNNYLGLANHPRLITAARAAAKQYGVGPGGLSGNDDAGQMSAWYVFGAMGFYPVCPGSNEYQLSSPIFKKVTLNLDKKYYPGEKFIIDTQTNSNKKPFSAVKLNGKIIEPVISHGDIQKRGKLKFLQEE